MGFTWKALTESRAGKLAVMCQLGAFWHSGYLGPAASSRVTEIQADEFPWHGFHIMHKHMLKIRSVGHVKAPPSPFPSLKVPLAHRVIFSFWLENCRGLLRGTGSSPGVFHRRNLHPVIGVLFLFPSQSERSPGMRCLSVPDSFWLMSVYQQQVPE